MKTILVLAGGSDSDEAVFATALAAARPHGAHLEFLHVHISPGEAASFTPHAEFAVGSGLRNTIGRLRTEAKERSEAAALHFDLFCDCEEITIADTPSESSGVTAAWYEERDDAVARMILRARHNDLVVVGRRSRANGLPPYLPELLLVGCGRPVILAASERPSHGFETILLCWKETAVAARALSTALPLMRTSKRVVIASVHENGEGSPAAIEDLARQLAWHGITAECRSLSASSRSTAEQLAAEARDCKADLLVMGGYGHSSTRETVFGGCTQHFIEQAELPVFMMH